jgi:hypothetical protein
MANIARDGKPKKIEPLKIHNGHYRMTANGVLVRALSKTQAAVYDGGLPVDALTKGAIEKRFLDGSQPEIHPSHKALPPAFGQAREAVGMASAVLAEAAGLGKSYATPAPAQKPTGGLTPRNNSNIVDRSAPGAVKARRV